MSIRDLQQPPGHDQDRSFAHTAFGLTLISDIPLPELSAAPSSADAKPVVIRLREEDFRRHIPKDLQQQPVGLQVTPHAAVVYLKDVAVFLLEDGAQVTVIPVPHAQPERIRQALTGIVMALILYQRGCLVLHGSAVSIEGKAVIFLGDSGEGKSSMAAALHAQGHLLLTDDLAAIEFGTPPRVAIAGIPIKLDPQMAAALQLQVPSQPLSIDSDKRLYHIEVPQNLSPPPLHRIFILGTAPQFTVTPLPLQTAVTELMRFAGLKAILPPRDPAHFSECAALAKVCPLFQLHRPKELARLPELATQIAQEIILAS